MVGEARPDWARLDASFRRNPKISVLADHGGTTGWQSIVMFLDSITYATHHLTDGFIPKTWPRNNGYHAACATLLVKVDLWWEVTDLNLADGPGPPTGWLINDYDAYQISRARWTETGRKRREASAKAHAHRYGRTNGKPR